MADKTTSMSGVIGAQRVLIVEDERIVARDIASQLTRSGYVVSAMVATGPAAIDEAAAHRPDVVLMDIGLAGAMTGVEAARAIRQRWDIPVIFLTGRQPDPSATGPLSCGEGTAFLEKPFHPAQLQRVLRRLIRQDPPADPAPDLQPSGELIPEPLEHLRQEQFRLVVEAAPNGMVMVDQAGKITLVNSQVERLFGYSRAELIGRPIEMLVPERFREKHPAYREEFSAAPQSRPMGHGRDLFGRRKDGSEIPVEIGLNPLKTDRGLFVLASIVDITERKRAEEQMRGSLKEKETLLKEIHHRVKNNLQVVSSLLSLQSNYIKDPELLAMFDDSKNRIKSIALVHERLYQSSDLSRIDMADYLRSLVEQLRQLYGVPESVRFTVDAEPVLLGIDSAVPCALIVHELVVNAMKHAFPDGRAGEVRLRLAKGAGARCELTIADNGVGLPQDLDIRNSESLGLSLVTDLVDQLQGAVALRRDEGATWTVAFPLKTEPERPRAEEPK